MNEQKRFLRHVKAYWEVHRHRIAPEIASVLDAAVQSGQLTYYAGRIETCQESEGKVAVTIKERHTQAEIVLPVDRIINCTGSNWNPRFAERSRSQFITLMNNLNLPYPKKMSEAVPANQRGGILMVLDYQI